MLRSNVFSVFYHVIALHYYLPLCEVMQRRPPLGAGIMVTTVCRLAIFTLRCQLHGYIGVGIPSLRFDTLVTTAATLVTCDRS